MEKMSEDERVEFEVLLLRVPLHKRGILRDYLNGLLEEQNRRNASNVERNTNVQGTD